MRLEPMEVCIDRHRRWPLPLCLPQKTMNRGGVCASPANQPVGRLAAFLSVKSQAPGDERFEILRRHAFQQNLPMVEINKKLTSLLQILLHRVRTKLFELKSGFQRIKARRCGKRFTDVLLGNCRNS